MCQGTCLRPQRRVAHLGPPPQWNLNKGRVTRKASCQSAELEQRQNGGKELGVETRKKADLN